MKVLDEIKARAEKATRGPWGCVDGGVRCVNPSRRDPDWHDWICQVNIMPMVGHQQLNQEVIAHARTDIPRLVAALEKAWEILEKMRSASSCDFSEMPYWANKAIVESQNVLNGEVK